MRLNFIGSPPDAATLDDHDLWVVSQNGFSQLAEFVEVEVYNEHAGPPADGSVWRPDVLAATATYKIKAPEGDVFTEAHNGRYVVLLEPEEIAVADDGFLPAQMLGEFLVGVGSDPGHRIIPADAFIETHQAGPGGSVELSLTVILASHDHQIVEWTEPSVEGRRVEVNIVIAPFAEGEEPEDDTNELPRETRTYTLDLDAGRYNFVLDVEGHPFHGNAFDVEGAPENHPPHAEGVAEDLTEPGEQPVTLSVTYTDEDGVDTETLDDHDIFVSHLIAWPHPIDQPFPNSELLINGGAGQLIGPDGQLLPFPNSVEIPATFVEATSEDEGRTVDATYEVSAPEGGWTVVDNGFYQIVLAEGEVADSTGKAAPRSRAIGGFSIQLDDEVPIEAEVGVTVERRNGQPVAVATIDFADDAWFVVTGKQEPVVEGTMVTVGATIERLAANIDPAVVFALIGRGSITLRHPLGPLANGDYALKYALNGEIAADATFTVEPPTTELEIHVEVEDIVESKSGPHAFEVRFSDADRLSEEKLRALYFIVSNFREVAEGAPFYSRAAELVELTLSSSGTVAEAVYHAPAPEGGWTSASNGEYVIALENQLILPPFPMPDLQRELARFSVEIDNDGGDHYEGDFELTVQEMNAAFRARVEVRFKDPYIMILEPGEPRRDGETFVIDATAGPVQFLREPDGPVLQEFDYNLGRPAPGEYHVVYRINGKAVAEADFVVEDGHDGGPVAEAEIPPVTEPGREPHHFTVTYRDEDGIDLDSLGDGDVFFVPPNTPPNALIAIWPAAFVGVVAEDEQTVRAEYALSPRGDGGWQPGNQSRWEAVLEAGSVADSSGNVNHRQVVGLFVVNISDEPGPRIEANMTVDAGEEHVTADVTVVFPDRGHTISNWGAPRREGHRIILDATAAEHDAADNKPARETHTYRLGSVDDFKNGGGGDGEEVLIEHLPTNMFPFDAPSEDFVVRSEDEWYTLWGQFPTDEAPGEPPVGFEEKMLLASFMGVRNSGGYSITIERLVEYDDHLSAHVVLRSPAPGDPVTEALTSPKDMVSLARSEKPVVFDRVSIVRSILEDEPRDMLPPARPHYEVVFRVNGKPHAHATFTVEGDGGGGDPEGEVDVSVDAAEGTAAVSVTVDLTEKPGFYVNDWGEIEGEGRELRLNITTAPDLTLTPAENAPANGGASDHTYTLDALAPGRYHLTVSLDGHPEARAHFLIRGNSRFWDWLEDHMPERPVNATLAGDANMEDADGDGKNDFLEYAMGSNPFRRDGDRGARGRFIEGEGGMAHFAMSFIRQKDATDVDYVIEISTDGLNWSSAEGQVDVVGTEELGNGLQEVTVCLKRPLDEDRFVLLRVRAEQK